MLRPDVRAGTGTVERLADLSICAAPGPDLALRQLFRDAGLDLERSGIRIVPPPAGPFSLAVGSTTLPALSDVPQNCTGIARLANGIQIFPGGVPIYRGNTLIGGIGVSGDGVDQDDMVGFLGVYDAGVALGGKISNAPPAMRADTLRPQGQNLRFVQCPQAPFLDTNDANPCDGK